MERVVITGMGVVSSAGCRLDEFWDTLINGKITYGHIDEFLGNKNYRVTIGAKIKSNDWKSNLAENLRLRYGKASQYSSSAALSALQDANLSLEDISAARVAVVIGTTMGEIQTEESISEIKNASGAENVSSQTLKQYKTDNIALAVLDAIKSRGQAFVIPTACAAGNYAIALGKRLIEWGYADIAIAGGVDVFSRVAFTGFQRLLSLAPDCCKPFDKKRKGLVVGEGCGLVILEKESHAKTRKARIYGSILGVGLSSDRHHMTSPHPEGDGAVRAMNTALKESGISIGDISYISAHGTGTSANDKVEVFAMSKVFGCDRIPPVSSIKSMLGHAMGAASALELIASLQMMKEGVILPTVNYSEPDPDCIIDCVPNKPRKADINITLSNSFAFGGQVSSLIIGKG
ncbi:MAG: beta-ketoacyl-[acyl-carrier-protein] synthase family protein [Bacillota bacterium]